MDARAPQSTSTASAAPATPVERLRLLLALRDAYRAGEPLPVEALDLVADAVDLLEAGAAPAEAFGLVLDAGQEHPARTLARERRDAHLRTALAACPGASTWAKATALGQAVRVFEGRRWQSWRTLDEPPARATLVERELWRAFRTGQRIPRSVPWLLRLAEGH
ncbi:hypothetical protein TK90_1234 [Thioalkalivibrio sp. K90mix]|uniref:hypothetical protein n=1 Tax=Thioalkalivibrio sp. (strain K90mix) TaxID=396595 RepID=UPI000195A3DB|nr:hypothetical protein [Thioalkalivibrio sp. K90mix]ADC71743.1 hypothetical protein TK90_1234 [Thioalkalivibrio sp. K90mix]